MKKPRIVWFDPGEEVIRFKNIRVASERHPEAVVVTYVYIYPNAFRKYWI